MLDLRPLGRAVREQRQRRSLTIRDLAERSGLSERFVSDLERGRGNISIARLASVSEALGVPVSSLASALDKSSPSSEFIALVGLRGAGKSTIGARLAERLGVRFIELDREIEAAAALPLAQIFELHGEAYYRRLERELLDRFLSAKGKGAVIAVGGGFVGDREAWAELKRGTRTVWLKARPEDHYARVMAQGDLRPMKNRPAAMAELRALLAAREPAYREADLVVDTSALGLEGSIERIADWA
jgi:XRE family transcriptional regulator, aerobic/anaerobic benzoate catabolism transcriptional regulator